MRALKRIGCFALLILFPEQADATGSTKRLQPGAEFQLRNPLTHKIETAYLYDDLTQKKERRFPPLLVFRNGTLVGVSKEQLLNPEQTTNDLARLKTQATTSIKKYFKVMPPDLNIELKVAHVGHFDRATNDITFASLLPAVDLVENPAGVVDLAAGNIYLPAFSKLEEHVVGGALINATNEVAKHKVGATKSVDRRIWEGLQRHFAELLHSKLDPHYQYGDFQNRNDIMQNVTEPRFLLGSALAKKIGPAKTRTLYFQTPIKPYVQEVFKQNLGPGTYEKIVKTLNDPHYTYLANALRASDVIDPRLSELAELGHDRFDEQKNWSAEKAGRYLRLSREAAFIKEGKKSRRALVARMVNLFPNDDADRLLTAEELHKATKSKLSLAAFKKELKLFSQLSLVFRKINPQGDDIYRPTRHARAIAQAQ